MKSKAKAKGSSKGATMHLFGIHAKKEKEAAKPSTSFSSNWEAMKAKVGANGEGAAKKRMRDQESNESSQGGGQGHKPKALQPEAEKKLDAKGPSQELTKVVAVDCEMVGIGPGGKRSSIARVCVINDEGNVLLDAYVRQKERVTDYRTWVSGIKPEHLLRGADGGRPLTLLTLEEVQARVSEMLEGRILVGHSLHNDLKALLLDHPRKDTRDTARYPILMRSPAPGRKPKPRALRHLAREELGVIIQEGEHSPVIDARAALFVYHKHRREWEKGIASGSLRRGQMEAKAFRKTVRESLETRALTGGAHGSSSSRGAHGSSSSRGGGIKGGPGLGVEEEGEEGEAGGGAFKGDNGGKGGKGKSVKALARRARMGIGKGQVAIARDLVMGGKGGGDVYKRDARLDPCADL